MMNTLSHHVGECALGVHIAAPTHDKFGLHLQDCEANRVDDCRRQNFLFGVRGKEPGQS